MDILSHTISGVAIGAVISAFCDPPAKRWKGWVVGAIGGIPERKFIAVNSGIHITDFFIRF